jgi:hypothetical protein
MVIGILLSTRKVVRVTDRETKKRTATADQVVSGRNLRIVETDGVVQREGENEKRIGTQDEEKMTTPSHPLAVPERVMALWIRST